jgi:hypothetical protein
MKNENGKNDKIQAHGVILNFQNSRDVNALIFNESLPTKPIDESESIANFVRDALRRNVLGGRKL